jgi:hypothetical protein
VNGLRCLRRVAVENNPVPTAGEASAADGLYLLSAQPPFLAISPRRSKIWKGRELTIRGSERMTPYRREQPFAERLWNRALRLAIWRSGA